LEQRDGPSQIQQTHQDQDNLQNALTLHTVLDLGRCVQLADTW
jgi:hypothetical protein